MPSSNGLSWFICENTRAGVYISGVNAPYVPEIPQTPANFFGSGEAFWFLVRAVNCVGPGSYEDSGSLFDLEGSRDAGINASALACP